MDCLPEFKQIVIACHCVNHLQWDLISICFLPDFLFGFVFNTLFITKTYMELCKSRDHLSAPTLKCKLTEVCHNSGKLNPTEVLWYQPKRM